MDLFHDKNDQDIKPYMPLARRMRPRVLGEFCGQEHLIGEGKLLRKALSSDRLGSLILYGPPGCGKTALASCIANETKAVFSRLNAVTASVGDLRQLISEAKNRVVSTGRKTIVFVDEIHRFNKMQQDALMPDVEEGNITLIGATVMNPFFSINPPLLSRSTIFTLEALNSRDIKSILKNALSDCVRGLGASGLDVSDDALEFIAEASNGDARRALNALELGAAAAEEGKFTLDSARQAMQDAGVVYDSDGDNHYDTVSAFIKSIRGSDPDAAVYWLAKMLAAGEDPLFIARRIAISASEDVGNADPTALLVAHAAMGVVQMIGMPEARITLSQAVLYLACAPKSNASYNAVNSAMDDIKQKKIIPVPVHLKDSSYRGASRMGSGKGYKYPHDYPGHFVVQEYAPGAEGRYFKPDGQGFEKEIMERLNELRKEKTQE